MASHVHRTAEDPRDPSRPNHRKKRPEVTIGSIVGSATGEADRDVVPGGWGGTDDATSTAPSDLPDICRTPDGLEPEPDIDKEADDMGGFSDLPDTGLEDEPPLSSRDR